MLRYSNGLTKFAGLDGNGDIKAVSTLPTGPQAHGVVSQPIVYRDRTIYISLNLVRA
jgi:hypothetical protein